VIADPIQVTIFEKSGGPLTKRISLAPDGSICSDGSKCVMPRGNASRFVFSARCMQAFAAVIDQFGSNQALATGALREDLPETVQVVTKQKLNGAGHPGVIARSQDYLTFRPGQAAVALLDFDRKGMPSAVADRLERSGGFWRALVSIIPAMVGVARVDRASTSAGLYNKITGERFPGSDGRHVFVAVKDGSDSERFLNVLHQRAWLARFGWMMVGEAGQLLERSIVDRVCGTPERLAFEGSPVLDPPLAQDVEARHAIAVEGDTLDTLAVCKPLTIVEIAKLEELRAKEKHRLAADSAKAREAFVERQSRRLAKRTGMDLQRARSIIERQCEGVLLPDVELPFDDPALAGKTVLDVLKDPSRFEGETLADPLEGVEYGPCKAQIMLRADGTPWINSFAHGRSVYELRLDCGAVRQALERTPKDEVPDAFVRYVLAADLRPDEVELLKHVAHDRSGVGVRALAAALKAALAQQAARRAQEERDRRAAKRQDPRPRLRVPANDAEFGPEMKTLNDVLGSDKSAEPPTRNPNKVVAQARKIRVPSLHLLTSTEANLDDDPNQPTAGP
jgi:hypothetical protein